MSKISLDWFLNKGFKLAKGDKYFDTNTGVYIEVAVATEDRCNKQDRFDKERFIESFAQRKTVEDNGADLPSNTPITAAKGTYKTTAAGIDWHMALLANMSWTYDLERLEKMYLEEQATPVFTEKMKASGELPPVGSKAIFSAIETARTSQNVKDQNGKIVVITEHQNGKHGLAKCHTEDGTFATTANSAWFLPLDYKKPSGLPEIGSALEYVSPATLPIDEQLFFKSWKTGDKLEVIAHSKDGKGEPIAVCRHSDGVSISLDKNCYRLPRTAEEIKQEKLVEDVCNIIRDGKGKLYSSTAEKLIKAIKESL